MKKINQHRLNAMIHARLNTSVRNVLGLIFLGMWICSIFLPAAYHVFQPSRPIGGFDVLLLGYMGLGGGQPGWFANPAFFIILPGFVFAGKPGGRMMRNRSVLLMLLGISAIWWHSWPMGTDYDAEITLGPGAYVWIAAMVGSASFAILRSFVPDELEQLLNPNEIGFAH